MKTKQTIRDSRDANDEQASAQHTLHKQQNTKSMDESRRVLWCERAARLFASALSLPFRSVLFMQKHRRVVHCFFFFFFFLSLSLSLFFWGRKKKKTPHPLCYYYCTRSVVRRTQPQDRCFTEIMDPQVGAQEVQNFCKAPIDGILHSVKFRHRFFLFSSFFSNSPLYPPGIKRQQMATGFDKNGSPPPPPPPPPGLCFL